MKKIQLLSYCFLMLLFFGNVYAIEKPTGLIAESVIMPGMSKEQVINITGIHSGMEKAIVTQSKIVTETWFIYYDTEEKKWTITSCATCEYWQISFVQEKVTGIRVLKSPS